MPYLFFVIAIMVSVLNLRIAIEIIENLCSVGRVSKGIFLGNSQNKGNASDDDILASGSPPKTRILLLD